MLTKPFEGGEDLFPAAGPPWALNDDLGVGKLALVEVAGQPFANALRLQTGQRLAHAWDLQIKAPLEGPLAVGPTYFVEFYARCTEGGGETAEGRSELVIEERKAPWNKTLEHTFSVGRDWKHFELPFAGRLDAKAGNAQVAFRLGFAPQTLEIAGFRLRRFDALKPADLPRTRATYAGSEPGALWRKQAEARIAQLRRSTLSVKVVDAHGLAMPAAKIEMSMKRHRFVLGTAVAERLMAKTNPLYNAQYAEAIPLYFNSLTLENGLKMACWEAGAGEGDGMFKRAWIAEILEWARQHELNVRGHVLVWPSWRWNPKRLKAMAGDKEALRAEILRHIAEIAAFTRGKVAAWDVVNEPYSEHDFLDVLGDDEMLSWFKAARAAEPKAQLCINDYGIFSSGGHDKAHQDHYDKAIARLKELGAPLQGVGIQSHLGSELTAPEHLLGLLDRFGRFGYPVRITEFDVEQDDPLVLPQYMRDYCTVLFSHPSVDGMVLWGHWDDIHWKKNALLFDHDFKLKPGGQAWADMFYKKWWTQVKGQSDAEGRWSSPGYHGTYELKVSAGGKTQSQTVELAPGGAELTVTLR